jgi:hypothetical protein
MYGFWSSSTTSSSLALHGLEPAEDGRVAAAADPLDGVVDGLAVGGLRVLEDVDAVDAGARADGCRRNHRLAAHKLLIGQDLEALDALVEELLAHDDVGVGAARVSVAKIISASLPFSVIFSG